MVLRKPRYQKNKWSSSWKKILWKHTQEFLSGYPFKFHPGSLFGCKLCPPFIFMGFNCPASPQKFWLGQKPRENTTPASQTSYRDILWITISNASFLHYVKWLQSHIFPVFLINGHVAGNAPARLSSWLVSQMLVLRSFIFTTSTCSTLSPAATLFNLTCFCLC